jgi:hypothetical protein
VIRSASQLLIPFLSIPEFRDEELALWATDRNNHPVQVPVGAFCHLIVAIHILYPNAPETSSQRDAVIAIMNTLCDAVARLLYVHPVPNMELPPHVRDIVAKYARDSQEPAIRLVQSLGKQWKQRCFAPDCLETHVDQRRTFQRCSACQMANYCSRECQRRSWTHGVAPHRDVCRVVATIRKQGHIHTYGGKMDAANALKRKFSATELQRAAANVDQLHALKFEELCESTSFYSLMHLDAHDTIAFPSSYHRFVVI